MEQEEKQETPVQEEEAQESAATENTLALELEECRAKLKEAEEKYLRAYADFDNSKKRLEREKYQAIDFANEKFARDLLSVVDTLELALQHSEKDADVAKIREGVALTMENLLKVLERHGVKQIVCEGAFDPNFHEAVMQVSNSEQEDGTIVQVMQKGYQYRERVLRPALVSVCKNQ
ncbi:MAG: nucleotide exchange factor GrpE [Campylobacterales bacterium]